MAAIAGAALVLVWPLETLLVGILAGAAFVLVEAYDASLRGHMVAERREESVRRASIVATAFVAVGVILVAMRPIVMAVVAISVALLACAVSAYERWSVAKRARPAPISNEMAISPEPIADVVPMPEDEPAVPTEAVADPVLAELATPPARRSLRRGPLRPRGAPAMRRRPAARTRRPGAARSSRSARPMRRADQPT